MLWTKQQHGSLRSRTYQYMAQAAELFILQAGIHTLDSRPVATMMYDMMTIMIDLIIEKYGEESGCG